MVVSPIALLCSLSASERWLIVITEDGSYLLNALQMLTADASGPPLTICYFDRRKTFTVFTARAKS